MARIAVIGAGLSGLVVATKLKQEHDVVVFDKSRGAGGRMATRYAGNYEFDHGAQFFTARTAEFQAFLEPLVERGVVANWRARFAEIDGTTVTSCCEWNDDYPHYVGTQRMNLVGKTLAANLDIHLGVTVSTLKSGKDGWQLTDQNTNFLGDFDWVILAMPAAQSAALAPVNTELHQQAMATRMQACFTLMLGFEFPLTLNWEAALIRGSDLSWISVNSSKPGRSEPFTLVIHSTNVFPDTRLDSDRELVTNELLTLASQVLGHDCRQADFVQLHRWLYANIKKRSGPSFYLDPDTRLAACGDWFSQGRVEAAFTSGNSLSGALLLTL